MPGMTPQMVQPPSRPPTSVDQMLNSDPVLAAHMLQHQQMLPWLLHQNYLLYQQHMTNKGGNSVPNTGMIQNQAIDTGVPFFMIGKQLEKLFQTCSATGIYQPFND